MMPGLYPSFLTSAPAGSDTTKYAMKKANCTSIANYVGELEDAGAG